MDQEYIRFLKTYYRPRIVSKVIMALDRNKEMKLSKVNFEFVSCLYYIVFAWKDVRFQLSKTALKMLVFIRTKLLNLMN